MQRVTDRRALVLEGTGDEKVTTVD